eukprot:1497953-Karenia_brevis.AAC.1
MELIEQMDVRDVKTEEHMPLPVKSPKVTVAALYVGPFVLDPILQKKADGWRQALENHFNVTIR